MLHCVACDSSCAPWEEYCEECLMIIAHWYDADQSNMEFNFYADHPRSIPSDYFDSRSNHTPIWALDSNPTEERRTFSLDFN